MRVEECFIIMVDGDAEVAEGANALFDKQKSKCDGVATFSVSGLGIGLTVQKLRYAGTINSGIAVAATPDAQSETSGSGEDAFHINLDSTLDFGMEPLGPKTAGLRKRQGVGAYLMFHNGRAEGVEPWGDNLNATPVELAEILRRTIADPKRLVKLVLMACKAAPISSKAVGKNVEVIQKSLVAIGEANAKEGAGSVGQSVQRSVLMSLLMELHKHQIYPMIAGWDRFVSILPHQPKQGGVTWPIYPGKDSDVPLSQQEIADRSGKSFVFSANKYHTPNDDERYGQLQNTNHVAPGEGKQYGNVEKMNGLKRVFWINANRNVVTCDQATWSDKNL